MIKNSRPYIAIIPSEGYERTFSSGELPLFNYYLQKATSVTTLNFKEPSESAYLSAGKFIVDNSDVMIAIWNGKPAQGPGGTADIVEYARMNRKSIIVFDTEELKVKEINR